MNDRYSPIVVGIALSLYGYNVSPLHRACRLYDHFQGNCMELEDLLFVLSGPRAAYAMTELPLPTALVYLQHALEAYGEEAFRRVTFVG